MIDAALVATLFLLVWVAVLIPPASRGAISKREAFERSLRGQLQSDVAYEAPTAPSAAARRRQILGGLLVAIFVSLILGVLPVFRIMLVVHLLLVDSFLAVVALVVYERDTGARRIRISIAATAPEAHWMQRISPAPTTHTAPATHIAGFPVTDPSELGLSA